MSIEIPDVVGGGDQGDDSKPGRRAILTVGGLVLVVSGILVGLSSPSAEDTSTTLPEEETATTVPHLNDSLDWRADEVGTTWPQRLVEFEGSLFFFATSDLGSPLGAGSGLNAWLLVDGVTWKSLGTVIEPPNQIDTVSATPRGLVAAGSANGKSLHLWSSTDGVEWHESELPDEPSNSEDFRWWAQSIGGTDDVTVVFASSSVDIGTLILDVLPANLKDAAGDPTLSLGWSSSPFEAYVHGPLGLTVFSATSEDLGLTEAEARELQEVRLPPTTVWTSADGRVWTPVDLEVGYVHNVVSAGGDLIASGYGGTGNEVWISPDGFDWERVAGGGDQEYLTSWRGGFVATRQGLGPPDIVYSEDRTTWEPFGVHEYLADDFSWQFQALAAGEGGLAAAITGYDETEFGYEASLPVVIERDGYDLTIDVGKGSVVLGSGDNVLLRLSTYTNQVADELMVDFRARSVTFLHPDSLEPLVSFTFDELEQAEAEAYGSQQPVNEEQQLVAFTSDGSTWTMESVSETFGDDVYVHALYVTDSQVIAVVAEYPNRFSAVPTSPNIVIWTAVIP